MAGDKHEKQTGIQGDERVGLPTWPKSWTFDKIKLAGIIGAFGEYKGKLPHRREKYLRTIKDPAAREEAKIVLQLLALNLKIGHNILSVEEAEVSKASKEAHYKIKNIRYWYETSPSARRPLKKIRRPR